MSDIVQLLNWRRSYRHGDKMCLVPHEMLCSAIDEIKRLRAALQSIAKNTCCGGCQEAARVAKAALSPTDGAPDNSPKVRTQNDQG